MILLTGVLVFVFYQFEQHPVLFNQVAIEEVRQSEFASEFKEIEEKHAIFHAKKKKAILAYTKAPNKEKDALLNLDKRGKEIRNEAKAIVLKANKDQSSKDSDYVFLTFILNYLPKGIMGLLIAVIISAAMSSTAGEINALASTTMVDFYQRLGKKELNDQEKVTVSKWFTLLWGAIAITFALFARLVENLIEAVNILGSVFYGTILGVFLTAFFLKFVKAKSVLIAAILAQAIVFILFFSKQIDISYLWYNLIGCALVFFGALIIQFGFLAVEKK